MRRLWRSGARGVAVALTVVVLAACGAIDEKATSSATASATPTAFASPTQTRTETPAPAHAPTATPTVEPSPVPSPTFTCTATTTPAPTAAPTPLPTSEGAERTARVPILMYHRIIELPADAGAAQRDYSVSPAQFEAQLRYMKEQGYQSISLYDLNRYLRVGGSLPDRSVILTFDDGYRDNFEAAFALLQKYGFTATFFINTQPIDDMYPAYMTWEQVEQMSREGMDIESHSNTHPRLDKLPADEIGREVRIANEMIEAHTGKTVHFFSYPYGHYDQQVVDILVSQGFWGAVTLRSGLVHNSRTMFDLPRVWVRYDDALDTFAAKLERGR